MASGVRVSEAQVKRPYIWHKALPSPFLCRGAGIYSILNRENGKIYVGSSMRLNHRWTEHRMELERKEHGNRYLQRAFQKNPDAFYLELIEEMDSPTKESLLDREQFWMNFFQSYDPEKGYNISPKAESCQGIKRSPEFLEKVSRSLKGVRWSEERKAHFRASRTWPKLGKWSEERRRNHNQHLWGTHHNHGWKVAEKLRLNPYWARRVMQFDLVGNYVSEYKTIKEAGMIFGGDHNIGEVCRGKRRLARGFQWRFYDESLRCGIGPVKPMAKKGPKFKAING